MSWKKDSLLSELGRSAEKCDTAKVLELIAQGARFDVEDSDGNSPLCLAAINGHTEAARALIGKGADINHRNDDGNSPLLLAAYYGSTDIAAALVDGGARLDYTSRGGNTAARWAAENGHEDIVRLIDARVSKDVHAAIAAAEKKPAPAPEPARTKWPKGFSL